ncbi:MAG: trehalose synthase [Bacteroidales bacterium]|nr:trehalose synthase [Bacteroidales bacterium]
MPDNHAINRLYNSFNELYSGNSLNLLNKFIEQLDNLKSKLSHIDSPSDWYKDVTVYSLYVDLFNKDFSGLSEKLDYLQNLGVNCLWLLPILDSPMKDAGFDIKNYKRIRKNLFRLPDNASTEEEKVLFKRFVDKAHDKGMRVIFDIAMNHTSVEHPWFQESRKNKNNPYRNYYIWNKDTDKYKDARLLFKGMCPSNWEKDGDCYFFHRFFEFQPDLNYRNPEVLLAMSQNLLFWLEQGVDGFRADAIPYIWKEEGTNCENLPKTHSVVKFFRAALDYVKPGTLLLAEACQKPADVVDYIKTGDECHAAYHFPLMPQMFKAIAKESAEPILNTLSPQVTPTIPIDSQWFTFLRCHDELSLELVYVNEEDRAYIHKNYCHQPEWDFRVGEGISARLSELFKFDVDKISLAYSLMLSLPGTPVIYYGDEFGKANDDTYYREMIQMTGKNDTRFLVRGKIDWEKVETLLNDEKSFNAIIFKRLKKLINTRKQYKAFGRGSIEWLNTKEETDNPILAFKRKYKKEELLIIHNLSKKEQYLEIQLNTSVDLLDQTLKSENGRLIIPAGSFYWLSKDQWID